MNLREIIYVLKALGTFLGLIRPDYDGPIFIKTIIGFIGNWYFCACEIKCINWQEGKANSNNKEADKSNGEYKDADEFEPLKTKCENDNEQENEVKPVIVNDLDLTIERPKDYINSMIVQFFDVDTKFIDYRISIMLIIKTLMENFIMGLYILCAAQKTNILEFIFVPFILIIMFCKSSFKLMNLITGYAWFWLLLQYLMFIINITEDSVPQKIDATIFIKAFH